MEIMSISFDILLPRRIPGYISRGLVGTRISTNRLIIFPSNDNQYRGHLIQVKWAQPLRDI